jgi:hypothetical protein
VYKQDAAKQKEQQGKAAGPEPKADEPKQEKKGDDIIDAEFKEEDGKS